MHFHKRLSQGKGTSCKEKIMCDVTMSAAANFVFE